MGSTFLRHFQQQTFAADYVETVGQRYSALVEHLLSRPTNLAPLNETNAESCSTTTNGVPTAQNDEYGGAIPFRPSAAGGGGADGHHEPSLFGHRYQQSQHQHENGSPVPEKSLNLSALAVAVNPSTFGAFNNARQLTLKFGELLKFCMPLTGCGGNGASVPQRLGDSASPQQQVGGGACAYGCLNMMAGGLARKESSDGGADLLIDDSLGTAAVPPAAKQTYRMVSVGLHCLRTLLSEISDKSPICCSSALNSLLHLLGALPPEALAGEPKEFVIGLFQLLAELRSSPCEDIATTSSSCMIALAVAYGAPELLLETALVYLSTVLNTSDERKRQLRDRIYIGVPENFYALHRLAFRQIGGSYYYADGDWSRCPLTEANILCSFTIPTAHPLHNAPSSVASSTSTLEEFKPKYASLATDGRFVYALNAYGLYKMGTGCGETKLGVIYARNAQLKATSDSWLACCNNVLYLRRQHSTKVFVLDNETLLDVGEILLAPQVAQGSLCSDGSSFYLLNIQESTKTLSLIALNDCFSIVDDDQQKFPVTESKLLALGDQHPWINNADLMAKFDSQADEITYIKVAKEAALLLDKSGRVFSGVGGGTRAAAAAAAAVGGQDGDQSGAESSNILRWTEISVPESVSSIIPSADGVSAILLCPSGQAYFAGSGTLKLIGTSKAAANRPKFSTQRPQRVSAPNNKRIIGGACSDGTVVLLTENGRLFVAGVGKQAPYSNPDTGQVLGLEHVHVAHVAMGKTHAVAVSKHGHVYTFGANHLGQCGRAELTAFRGPTTTDSDSDRSKTDDDSGGRGDASSLATAAIVGWAAGFSTGGGPVRLCAPNEHIWRIETATICTACGFCSARGYVCPSSKDKAKGSACGCGTGWSGCVNCGVCRTCGKQYHRASGSERDSEGESAGAQPYPQLMPAKLTLRPVGDCRAAEVACGNYHTIVRTVDGHVVTFGSNRHGQLGVGDVKSRIGPQFVLLPTSVVTAQVAAGANHCVVRTTDGLVYTFGKHHNGQLGRDGRASSVWFAAPGLVEGFGAESKKNATWVSAGGDVSVIIYEQNLFTTSTLSSACITANQFAFAVFPKATKKDKGHYFVLKRGSNGSTATASKIVKLRFGVDGGENGGGGGGGGSVWCLDPHYNTFWSYSIENGRMSCHVPTGKVNFAHPLSYLQNPEFWIPMKHQSVVESQVGLSLLACYYSLSATRFRLGGYSSGLGGGGNEFDHIDGTLTAGLKENCQEVCRFQSFGGGWGYSLQSVEAIQFSVSRDVWILGYGLFGGRGEYLARIKLLRTSSSNGDEERSVESLAETDEILYECGPKEKCPIYFAKPVFCRANRWYVAWTSINGPSSDCGAGGMASVMTEDGITFYFRNSRLSNNGTDVHVGQVPLLLYSPSKQVPTEKQASDVSPSTVGSSTATLIDRPLSQRFYLALTPRYFSTLVDLLSLATAVVFRADSSSSTIQQQQMSTTTRSSVSALSESKIREWECERAAAVAIFSLRLSNVAINLLYPKNRPPGSTEKPDFVASVGDCSDLILRVLDNEVTDECEMTKRITLTECREFLLDLFQLFFPTPASICSYMQSLMKAPHQGIWAMDAFLTALSRLESPVTCLFTADCSDSAPIPYPLLAGHLQKMRKSKNRPQLDFISVAHFLMELLFETKIDQGGGSGVSDRDQASSAAVELLVRVAADLVQAVGDGNEAGAGAAGSSSPTLFQTPKRFGRLSSTTSWDTGGGSPDAIAFQVDRSGVSVHGAGVYTGFGSFTYSLELLVNQGDHVSEKWMTLEKSSGNVDARDCANDIAYVKLHKPVKLEAHSMYALRLRMNGGRTWNGECGVASVTGYKGVRVTFYPCTQSLNGTSVNRGQLPTILYSLATNTHSSRCLEPSVAIKWTLSLVKSLVVRLEANLQATVNAKSQHVADVSREDPIFGRMKNFIPRLFAHLSIFVEQNPLITFDVASSFDELLMTVFSINSGRRRLADAERNPTAGGGGGESGATPTSFPNSPPSMERVERIAIESDHPYKPCKVYSYIARFDLDISYMTLEFDANCCTSQPEDSLQMYLTSYNGQFYPIAKLFGGSRNWPKSILLLPGNSVWFVLETASNYTKAEAGSMYGFKCLVTGYASLDDDALYLLEAELVNLCSYCCRQLIEKSYHFSQIQPNGAGGLGSVLQDSGDVRALEEETDDMVRDHMALLRKGLHLEHAPNVHELIAGKLPLKKVSPELRFLRDFISAAATTAGGKLARWMMPEAYVDPFHCEMVLDLENLRSGQTAVITIITKDQYGRVVHAASAAVEVFVSSVGQQQNEDKDQQQQHSSVLSPGRPPESKVSTPVAVGLPEDPVEIAYQPTYLNKARYTAVTMMKPGQKWSFEELRLMHFREAISKESLHVLSSRDGAYTATWIPKQSGYYRVECRIDAISISQIHNVEVHNGQIVNRKPSRRSAYLSRARMATVHKEDTQGVRVRTAPSLQAPQTGLLPAGATVFYVDECENSDGVWLRLNDESAVSFCTKLSNPLQAWCLQYHVHLRKTLLYRDSDAVPAANANPTVAPTMFSQNTQSVIVACDEEYVVRKSETSKGTPVRAQPQKGAKVLYYMASNDIVQSTGWLQNADAEIWIQVFVDVKGSTSMKTSNATGGPVDGYCLVQEPNGTAYLECFVSPPSSRTSSIHLPHQQAIAADWTCNNIANGNEDSDMRSTPGSSSSVRQTSTQTSPGDRQRKLPVAAGAPAPSRGGTSRASSARVSKPIVKVAPQQIASGPAANHQQSGPALSAMSPSIADSIRAVFAALLWHEHIVHDAMACSAYLKFHPVLQRVQFRQDLTVNGVAAGNNSATNDYFQSNIPIGLQMLHSLWKEVFVAIQTVIEKHWILPSPPMAVKTPDQRPFGSSSTMPPLHQPNNQQQDSSSVQHQQQQLQFCELCEGWFPQTVTLHMRSVHPGCGSHAGGQGYNSLGRYTGGWTGNCGDGGLGSSPWYLLCHRCRANYLQTTDTQRQRQRRDKARMFRISAGNVEPQRVLKNNAMFLLELNMRDDDESFSSKPGGGGGDESSAFGGAGGGGVGVGGHHKSRPSKPAQTPKQSDWVVNLFPRQTAGSSSSEESNGAAGSRLRSRDSTHNGQLDLVAEGIIGPVLDGHAFASDPGPKLSKTDDEMSLPSSEPTSGQQPISVARRTRTSSIMIPGSASDFQCLASPSHALQAAVRLDTTNSSVQATLRRPTIAFVIQHHDLSHVRGAMRLAVIRTVLLEYAFQVFIWLLRNGTSPTAVVDVLLHFVTAMMNLKSAPPSQQHQNNFGVDKTLPHPLKLTLLAGAIRQGVVRQFHAFLQTIAGVLRHHERVSFDALRGCLRSFMFQFTTHDQDLILKSRILSTLSSIMSDRRDESSSLTNFFNRGARLSLWSSMAELEELVDLTRLLVVEAASRRAMVPSLVDGTTETFWESGDEEKGKTKLLTVRWPADHNSLPVLLSVYIDNCQDVRHRISQVSFTAIVNGEPRKRLKTQTLETQFVGWVKCYVALYGAVCIELKSPDPYVRLRQIFLSGVVRKELPTVNEPQQQQQPMMKHSPSVIMQFDAVQTDAFDLFQLLASNAFGDSNNDGSGTASTAATSASAAGAGHNLQQQVLNILFSRNQMHALQSYVSSQMVNALEREVLLLRDKLKRNYTYCCGLMTMLSRVSSSHTGRQSIISKTSLLTSLSELPLFSSPIVQCQALETIEKLVSVFDPRRANADALVGNMLILITKALTLQIRQRPSQVSKTVTASSVLSEEGRLLKWHAYRPTSTQIAQFAIKFLTETAVNERYGVAWSTAVKTSVANEIASMALLASDMRDSPSAVRHASFWLAAGALCVCQNQDWLQFSPAWRSLLSKASVQATLCENHDDGRTMAVLFCEQCKLHMCADCSSVLHLNRKSRTHVMQQLATADTQVQVIVHETCSRLKLNWLLLSVDRSTMNGMAEFRPPVDALMHLSSTSGPMQQRSSASLGLTTGPRRCRFCDSPTTTELHDTCTRSECQSLLAAACRKALACGHICGGVLNEDTCPPCLRCHDVSLKQDSDDMCVICFTETLAAAPIVQLSCAHVFHYHCCSATLSRRWPGPRMTFAFMCCPICKVPMEHAALGDLLDPLIEMRDDVRRKAMVRLEYDGLAQCSQVTAPGGPYFNDAASFAMDRYAYYLCHKCQRPYFGGEAQCQQLNSSNDYNPMELLCGGCSDVSRAQICPRHGSTYLEYKCRYCCSIAVFFCFGTTHFCAACHDDFQRLIGLPRDQLPACPAGPRSTSLEPGEQCPLKTHHPPTGEEFALGCGICRNLSSF